MIGRSVCPGSDFAIGAYLEASRQGLRVDPAPDVLQGITLVRTDHSEWDLKPARSHPRPEAIRNARGAGGLAFTGGLNSRCEIRSPTASLVFSRWQPLPWILSPWCCLGCSLGAAPRGTPLACGPDG